MKRLLIVAAAVALTGLMPSAVRADEISPSDLVSYSFTWTHTIPGSVILADGETNAGVQMTQESGSGTGPTDFVASNLTTFSKAGHDNPSRLDVNGAYKLTLTLTDNASGKSQSVDFFGKLGTTKTGFGTDFAKVTNTFASTAPVTLFFAESGNTYIVKLDQYTPPGNPTQTNGTTTQSKGAIGGSIETIAPGGVQKVPEPSALLLTGFGLCAGVWWRRRVLVA